MLTVLGNYLEIKEKDSLWVKEASKVIFTKWQGCMKRNGVLQWNDKGPNRAVADNSVSNIGTILVLHQCLEITQQRH